MIDWRPPKAFKGELFRTDAKAEGNDVAVGGWECQGGRKPTGARWFVVKLTVENTPWLHCRGEPFRVVAALELLATLYAVLASIPEGGNEDGSATVTGTAATGNIGDAYVVARMMTTSFPLNVILMELTEQLDKRGSWLSVEWAPRQQNEHADALTNGVFSDFDPNKRVPLDPGAISSALPPS